MKKVFFLILILQTFFCFSQTLKKDSLDIYKRKWFSYGVSYESASSILGFSFGNGLKERPIIHFEDFSDYFLYYANFQGNSEYDYSYNIDIGLKYYLHSVGIVFSYLNVHQKNIKSNNFFQRNISFKNEIRFNFLNNSLLLFNVGYQSLDHHYNNFGISLGIQRSFRLNSKKVNKNFYLGFLYGKYTGYNSYSAFLHSFIFQDKMSLRVSYDFVKELSVLNLGLNIILSKRKEIKND